MAPGEPTRQSSLSAPGEPGAGRPSRIVRATWRIDVSQAVPLEGRFEVAVDVIVPSGRPENSPSVALACLPGGFLSRRYYDLGHDLAQDLGQGGDGSYSFAEAMVSRGFAVLAFDHLGIGDSSKPEPIEGGYALGVEAVARVNQLALERALELLEAGDPAQGIPATRCTATIGVGHSMGSVLTVEQQAQARPHRALVLFSFSTKGLPRFLNEDQLGYAHDPVRTRRELGELVRRSFGTPYPPRPNQDETNRRAAFGVGTAPHFTEALLEGASTDLLAAGGLLSMIPGGYAPSAEAIDVPVYILIGDHDLHGARELADELPKCPEKTTRVLEDCWHCHFVANTRAAIWSEIPAWIHQVLAK
jgi:alpha-beta hydrolase superfamily lysophospholipase